MDVSTKYLQKYLNWFRSKETLKGSASFIVWFIAVPAKITKSGHQTELKMYERHFFKAAWEELDRLIEAT